MSIYLTSIGTCIDYANFGPQMALKRPLKTLKKYNKKSQKHEIVRNLWQIPRLKRLSYQIPEASC